MSAWVLVVLAAAAPARDVERPLVASWGLVDAARGIAYVYTDPHGNTFHGTAANLCSQLDVNVWSTNNTYSTATGTCLYGGAGTCASFDNSHTLSSFATAHGSAATALDLASAGLAPGAANSKYVVIEVQLDSAADNSYQALQSSGAFNFELVQ